VWSRAWRRSSKLSELRRDARVVPVLQRQAHACLRAEAAGTVLALHSSPMHRHGVMPERATFSARCSDARASHFQCKVQLILSATIGTPRRRRGRQPSGSATATMHQGRWSTECGRQADGAKQHFESSSWASRRRSLHSMKCVGTCHCVSRPSLARRRRQVKAARRIMLSSQVLFRQR